MHFKTFASWVDDIASVCTFQNGRGVPVIIPEDSVNALEFLVDDDVRQEASILKENQYVFANRGMCITL